MTTSGDSPATPGSGILDSADAGQRAIRGGALRSGGYAIGLLLSLASAPLLTRYLGVEDFGHYVAVLSLVTVIALVADAGLTVVGVREYAIRDADGRRRLMGNIVTLRVLIAGAGILLAVAYAAAAGFGASLVVGTALAGVGMLLAMMQHTYTVPLSADLRLGTATALDLLRQVLTVAGLVGLIIAGAALTAFFALAIPVGLVVLVATVIAIKGGGGMRLAFDRDELRYLLRETAPAAASSLLASIFYRVAIVLLPLIVSAEQLGYFSASFRIVEAIIAVPSLIAGAAFPILAHAAEMNRERLVYVLQRLFDVAVLLGPLVALCAVLGAAPAMAVIAGSEFDAAVPMLRVQGLALAASFLIPIWAAALWVTGARAPLVRAGVTGVAAAAALTVALATAFDALGAAIAMSLAETVFAGALAVALMRPNPDLRPSLGRVPKSLLALAAAAPTALLPLPDAVVATIAGLVYVAVLVALRGIPDEIWDAAPLPDRVVRALARR